MTAAGEANASLTPEVATVCSTSSEYDLYGFPVADWEAYSAWRSSDTCHSLQKVCGRGCWICVYACV